jgi:ATP-dependent DNA helicase RecG
MNAKLESYIRAGEGVNLEFKRCGGKVERDVYETICSFANRQGGSILLGVLDDGTVSGVNPKAASSIERNVVNVVNDPGMFNVAPALEFERLEGDDGKVVIRVWVPMGPALYSFKGTVYDRAADVDVKVKTEAQHAAMIIRKQNFYTEKTVYPWVSEADLDLEVLSDVRREVRAARADHPWLSMDDGELLKSSRLWSRDPATGEYGFNLAAVMLLGKQETILDVAPVYRTDVVLQRSSNGRYDDRLVCKSNLVKAYGEISDFCRKWMPDVFSLDEGGSRISVRDIIVRELVVNTLIHREYTSPHIARITIDADGIHTHNASRALYAGPVTLENLDPTPKNPVIANFFTQMGRSEELGSGVRNLYKCSRLYSGRFPRMSDGDSFEAFVPTPLSAADAGSGKASGVLLRKRDRTAAEVEGAAMALVAKYGAVPASEIAAEVTTVGERTVRRYLSGMVDEGRLSVKKRGRGTVYCKPGDRDS